MTLTKSQQEAVFIENKNVLINAGAGSGKTSAFTARVVDLIKNKNADPGSILALTFTKEAADNLRKRLSKVVGKSVASKVAISTFHSFAYKTLKEHYPSDYIGKDIIKTWWKFSKLYDLINAPSYNNPDGLNMVNSETGSAIAAGDLAQFISYQKANMVKPHTPIIINEDLAYIDTVSENKLQEAYDKYGDYVKHARVLEFDDMLVDLYYHLRDEKEFRSEIKNQYQYIMVDEMQDTNTVNMAILKLISDNNLFAVGDFRQGIYSFINANIDNILTFDSEFEDVSVIEFRENFRSTKRIVDLSNRIIEASPVEEYKKFKSQTAARKEKGDPIIMKYHQLEADETEDIIDDIIFKTSSGETMYSDYAIICRTNSQLGVFESRLAMENIPVDISTSKSFFDRKEISDLLSYAQHIIEPEDDMSLRMILNSPNRFISKKTINDLDKFAFSNSISLEGAISSMDCGRSQASLSKLVNLFEDLRELENSNPSKILKTIFNKIDYGKHLKTRATNHVDLIAKEEAVERLFGIAKQFPTIRAFLAHVSIIKNNNKSNKDDAVRLLTVHASKGLEFKNVYAPGVTASNYPHPMNHNYEEERRLLYVLFSRAKDNLMVSSHVFQNGKAETTKVCPFLVDVFGSDIKGLRRAAMGERSTHEIQLQ